MSSSANGRHGGPDDPIRRLRYDDVVTIVEPAGARRGSEGVEKATVPGMGRTYSGRRFVILAAIAVLAVWGTLYVVFREWRARYRVRAAYGSNQVAPAIDALAGVVPPGIEAGRWRDAVARTRAMLVTVTASNLLGLDEMRDLREELDRAAARAREHPNAAIAELSAVWDNMSERGEFLLRDTRSLDVDRHPRPAILPSYGEDRVAPGLDPLRDLAPPGVDRDAWLAAIDRTRALLLDVTSSRLIGTLRMKDLRADIDRIVARARSQPESAVRDLADLWDSLQRSGRSLAPDRRPEIDRHDRPPIFP